MVDANPCRQIRKLSEKSNERPAYIGFSDVNRIMCVSPPWYQDVIWIAYLTGMRKGEIAGLKWSQINLDKGIIKFHSTETKEGKFKRIPIHQELLSLLKGIGKVRNLGDDSLFQVSYESLQHPWYRSLDKLGWNGAKPRFHDLRHTWKTNARRSGIDSEIRESILGHGNRSLDVRERYGVIDDRELVLAIDKFTYDHGETEIQAMSKVGTKSR